MLKRPRFKPHYHIEIIEGEGVFILSEIEQTVLQGRLYEQVAPLLDGRPLVLLNQLGCLVRLHPTEILVDDPTMFGCHNILVTRDRQILINDTVNKATVVYDANGQLQKRLELKRYGFVRKILWRHGIRTARLWLGKYSPSDRVSQLLVRNVSSSRPVASGGHLEPARARSDSHGGQP